MDNRMQLKQRIGAYQFAVWEMTLYLDTHPQCAAALSKYDEYRAMVARLIEEYEANYGAWEPDSNSVRGECWSWVGGPWPWEGGI